MKIARFATAFIGLALLAGCGAPTLSSPAASTVTAPVAAADTTNAVAATATTTDYSLDATKGGSHKRTPPTAAQIAAMKAKWAAQPKKPRTPPTAAQIAAFKAKAGTFKGRGHRAKPAAAAPAS